MKELILDMQALAKGALMGAALLGLIVLVGFIISAPYLILVQLLGFENEIANTVISTIWIFMVIGGVTALIDRNL